MRLPRWPRIAVLASSILLAASAAAAQMRPASSPAEEGGLRQGDVIDLGGRSVAVWTLDTLPFVENKYTQKFVFDRYDDPKLDELRFKCRLDDVAAPGRGEFERQLLLMEWVNSQIEYGDPQAAGKGKVRDPMEILKLAGQEQKLYCENFASLLISAAASMGYVCRPVDIPTHSFNEMWSSQHRRWVMLDPTGHFYAAKDGLPQNMYELRKDYFAGGGRTYSFFRGADHRRTSGRSFAPYYVLYYPFKREYLGNVPRGGALATRDDITKGRGRGDYEAFEDPASDPYFPVNQASITLAPEGRDLRVKLRTFTPNFKTFRVRIDGGPWADSNDTFLWKLREGANILEAQSINLFDVGGTVSTVELGVGNAAAADIVLPACNFAAEGGGKVITRGREGGMPPSYVHLWSTKDHWLEWAIENAKAGQYDVTLTYATRFHPSRQISVNGAPPNAAGDSRFTLGPTGSWQAFADSRLPFKVDLKEGANVLRLTCLDESSAAVSAIRLTAPDRKDIVIDATKLYAQGGGEAKTVLSPRGYFRQWDANGHWLEWTVETAEEGAYIVSLRYATMYASPRSMEVNGEVVKGLESFTMPLTGGWQNWAEQKLAAPVTLRAGRNVIRMTSLGGGGLNLAGMRLAASDGKEIDVGSVNFTAQGGGSVVAYGPSRHRSFHNWEEKGHWIEWTARAPRDGEYEVTLHCASAEKSTREVRVNGEAAKGLESAAFEPTGNWQMWKDVKLPAKVHLKKGDNVLRLTCLSGGLNLDEIRLSPASD